MYTQTPTSTHTAYTAGALCSTHMTCTMRSMRSALTIPALRFSSTIGPRIGPGLGPGAVQHQAGGWAGIAERLYAEAGRAVASGSSSLAASSQRVFSCSSGVLKSASLYVRSVKCRHSMHRLQRGTHTHMQAHALQPAHARTGTCYMPMHTHTHTHKHSLSRAEAWCVNST